MKELLEPKSEGEKSGYTEEELEIEEVDDPDIMYSKKKDNAEGSLYELDQVSDNLEDLESYLEDIQLEINSDVRQVAVDLDNQRAVMLNSEGQEIYELLDADGENSFYKAQVYNQDKAALVEKNEMLTKVYTGENSFEAGGKVNSRINLFEGIQNEVEKAKKRKEVAEKDSEYAFRMGESMSQMIDALDGATEMKFRNKMQDTMTKDLPMGELNGKEFDSFSEYADIANKWNKWSDERLIYMKIGDYRFFTVDGSEIEPLEDKTVYGVGASTAKKKNTGLNELSVANMLRRQSGEGFKELVEEGVSQSFL